MRKLSPKELTFLMGAMAIGHYAFAQDDGEELPTQNLDAVEVSAVYEPPPDVGTFADEIDITPYGGGGGLVAPTVAQQDHLWGCAYSYAPSNAHPNFMVYNNNPFQSSWGWGAKNAQGVGVDWRATEINQSPSYGNPPIPPGNGAVGDWYPINGITLPSTYETFLFMWAYTSEADTIEILVHEWYHQNHDVVGESNAAFLANEAGAKDAGQSARNAFIAAGGTCPAL